jgi:hypothetical protein
VPRTQHPKHSLHISSPPEGTSHLFIPLSDSARGESFIYWIHWRVPMPYGPRDDNEGRTGRPTTICAYVNGCSNCSAHGYEKMPPRGVGCVRGEAWRISCSLRGMSIGSDGDQSVPIAGSYRHRRSEMNRGTVYRKEAERRPCQRRRRCLVFETRNPGRRDRANRQTFLTSSERASNGLF